MLLLGAVLLGTTLHAEVQYFEVNVAPADGSAAKQKETMFWRVEIAQDEDQDPEGAVQIFDLCREGGRRIAVANGDKNQWQTEKQTGKVDTQGNLTIETEKGEYARGHTIEPMECKNGQPTKPIVLLVPPFTKKSSSSGMKHLLDARGKTLTVIREVSPTTTSKETQKKVDAGTLVCSPAPMTERAIRELSDRPAFTHEAQMYPGSIIQGKPFSEGSHALWVPVSIKRSGGKLLVQGLTFKDPTASKEAHLDEITPGNVEQAKSELIGQPVKGVAATIAWDMKQVYSKEDMLFAFGADARYLGNTIETNFAIDSKSSKNFIVARLQQIYYYVSFTQEGTDPWDVFAAGENFTDPWNRLGANNPPLYVSKVGYGRAIYFVASSEDSASTITAALNGAYEDATGISVSTANESKYDKVLSHTKVSYFALGGSANELAKPINTTSPEKMFAAIKKVIADMNVIKGVGDGVPISYNLNYLISQAPATMGYATAYDMRNCEILTTNYWTFLLEQLCVDDRLSMDISVKPQPQAQFIPVGGGFIDTYGGDINFKVPTVTNLLGMVAENPSDKWYQLHLRLRNYGGGSCHTFRIKREKVADQANPATGKRDVEVEYLQEDLATFGKKPVELRTNGTWNLGEVAHLKWNFNPAAGNAQLVENGGYTTNPPPPPPPPRRRR